MAVGPRKAGIDNETAPVLHQCVPHEAELGFLAGALAQQPGVGIGGAGMGVVRRQRL